MKNLLVLVLVACCSCSFSFDTWGQMLDEGTTVTTEIEQQGNVETVTETTVTIENKTTGDVLDSDNGIVAARITPAIVVCIPECKMKYHKNNPPNKYILTILTLL